MNRLQRMVIAAVVFAVMPTGVSAQTAQPFDLNIQRFRPSIDSRSFITVERSRILGTFEPSLGIYTNFAWAPLKQTIGDEEVELVETHIAGTFILTLGFFNVFEIGGQLPISVIRGDPDGPGDLDELDSDGFGDAEVHTKVQVLNGDKFPVGVAAFMSVGFNSGQENAFISSGQTPILRPGLAVDWHLGPRVAMGVNAGATFQETRTIAGNVTVTDTDNLTQVELPRQDPIVVGNEINYAFAVGFSAVPERLDFILETYGAVPMISEAERAMPLEVLLGCKVYLLGNSFLSLGLTRGLLDGYGDPDLRAFAGIIFEPSVGDQDRDGLSDDVDECPTRPEDKDGFEDEDGCPDTDNDMDRIPDIADQCPDTPEDRNGFEDEDGCPDGTRDRDQDGLIDSEDQCPDEPEDRDGFQDQDGCPDPDNDMDGILDAPDRCPMTPEDYDGYEDEDGCPDPDNDKDGIADVKDRCPDQPENINGVEDEDGCPERKVVLTRDKIEINEKVYFETDKAVIKPESYGLLDEVAAVLRKYPQVEKVEVQGHTDSRGSDTYNLDLSDRRAGAVKAYLVQRGIEAARLESRGYGETRPVDPGENKAAWSKNRRVEFIIIKRPADGSSRQTP
ncbi:MAG: OmpA family protein [Myxococcota bacterium]|nr:OmpA family protein [Myxococcota bacterium]